MNDRPTASTINDAQLDQLYERLEDDAKVIAHLEDGEKLRLSAEAQLAAVADLIADHEGDEWAAHPATTALRGILNSEEHAIAQPSTAQANLLVTVTAPNPVNAVRWAGHVRDLVHAEFDGSMGLHSFIELEPGGSVRTTVNNPPVCELPHQTIDEEDACEQERPAGRTPGFTRSGQNAHHFTYRPVTPEMERAATERAVQAAADSERAAAWFAATGGVLGAPGCSPGQEETEPDNPAADATHTTRHARVRIRTWNGHHDPALAAWAGPAAAWDGDQLVIRTGDGETRPEPGWSLVRWPDGEVIVASPWAVSQCYQPLPVAPADENRLAQSGADTRGCDCGHDGMGISWHGDDCPWRCRVLEGTAPVPAATQAADIETTARIFAALHRSAEDTVTRVIDLHERWSLAGPPLGKSMTGYFEWWRSHLAELHDAIQPPAEQPARTTAKNPPTPRELIDTALRTTPRADCADWPAREPHGQGHRYDMRCALCAGDADALTDAVHAALQPRLAALAEYENAVTWMTDCLNCARILDNSIRETERAERAENAVAHARSLHRETCPLARGKIGRAAFTCGMCDALDGPDTTTPGDLAAEQHPGAKEQP